MSGRAVDRPAGSGTSTTTDGLTRQLDVAREYTQKLSEKIQQQARELQLQSQQLAELESYKELCETRLQQVIPLVPAVTFDSLFLAGEPQSSSTSHAKACCRGWHPTSTAREISDAFTHTSTLSSTLSDTSTAQRARD